MAEKQITVEQSSATTVIIRLTATSEAKPPAPVTKESPKIAQPSPEPIDGIDIIRSWPAPIQDKFLAIRHTFKPDTIRQMVEEWTKEHHANDDANRFKPSGHFCTWKLKKLAEEQRTERRPAGLALPEGMTAYQYMKQHGVFDD
jgi:hypothetical protein